MVKGDTAGAHRHRHGLRYAVALFSEASDDAVVLCGKADRVQAAVLVRARNELQAAVFDADVVHRDPGRQRADRVHGPVGRVLMPVGLFALLAGWLDHRVVMVDAHVPAAAQLACVLAQTQVKRDFLGVGIVGPQVDHLIENAFIVLGAAPAHFGADDAFALAGDGIVQRQAQGSDFRRRKEVVILNVAVVLEELYLGGVNDSFRHISVSCLIGGSPVGNLSPGPVPGTCRSPRIGVRGIAQAVADKVESEHRDHHQQPRREQPRR